MASTSAAKEVTTDTQYFSGGLNNTKELDKPMN
jgi:hypothetical protein